eukprot:TRINITY_DN57455_c0_g1_i1.p1 TRINITY_DN57455_c0_g1~~TRINITY_DN57455_c0_g1_i1.p1  ORF type:complete len:153 (+),score=42.51 TRINITY_DN57455_c0_g1_i1:229-687(+)
MLGMRVTILVLTLFALSSSTGTAARIVKRQLREINDPCPFGYGDHCGTGKPLSEEQKKKVAGILEGLIKKLGGHDHALVQQESAVNSESVLDASFESYVSEKLSIALEHEGLAKEVAASLSSSETVDGMDPEAKEKVAKILKDLIKKLSKGK